MTRTKIVQNLKLATAAAALMVTAGGSSAYAALQHGSGQSGSHETHDSSSQADSGHQDSSAQGKRQGKSRTPGESTGRGQRSLEDIMRDIGSEEDSDRPEWAGGGGGPNDRGTRPADAGSARGDLYGDMYVILRDANGVPILTPQGFVQPVDANGNPIPLDAEGAPVDPSLALEVELSRLNAGRSPDQVLDRRAEEVVAMLNSATAITTDAAGRLVLTVDGVAKTIDSPLENMALYVALMTSGTIPGVTSLPGTEFDHLVDGVRTSADLTTAASLLAGAADKFAPVSLDAVAYINAILGIDTKKTGTVTYSQIDYSTFSYDRSDVYGDVKATVLIKQPDGSYKPTEVSVYEAVFKSQDYSATGTFAGFAQSVDDARAIINYIHEYEVPAD
jgi:hypothetical protein